MSKLETPPLATEATARPAAVAAQLRAQKIPGVALLESGLDQDGLGRFSFVCARPLAVAVAEPGEDLKLVSGPDHLPTSWPGDPLQGAADLMRRTGQGQPAPKPPFPFSGGAIITLAYDLGRRYERWPDQARADAAPPDLHVAVYEHVIGFDHLRGDVRVFGEGPGRLELERAVEEADPDWDVPESESIPAADREAPSTFDAVEYQKAVEEARRLIRRGDLFEVNLSRRYEVLRLDLDRTYSAMCALAPAPFMADLELDKGRRVLSASPERFLSLTPDGRATSWPIKGTRPRGVDPADDARLSEELLESEKERAELAMIIDLVRNDLGRVAHPGTVRVLHDRLLQTWPTVHHTVGVVEAQLEEGQDWADLVRAAFPPGSVTGAPKIRASEVIDELEPVRRGLYCGAFGYVGWDGAMDLAVAIRIVASEGDRALIHAGGAVLLASDPAAEERETVVKALALLRAAAWESLLGVGERIAIISDIHSNLEALVAVMRDIEARRVKRIYCLGDLIGYGPSPNEVIEIAMRNFEFVIKGNHDEAISYKIPKRFKRLAAKAAFWTRKQVKPRKAPGYREKRKRWSYVKKFPHTEELGPWVMAHGSVESNLDYVHDATTALEVFEDMRKSKLCFLGHTHVPGIFLLDNNKEDVHYLEPEDGKRYSLNGAHRAIINVGSVGQPRDGDNRACWVLAREDGSFSFRRVAYDIDSCAEKIFRTRGLPSSLGERLFDGE